MLTILQGDCLEKLRELPAESVHCCVTSPPYWGLRDYGIPPTIWGGDPACDHDWQARRYYTEKSAGKASSDAFHTAGADNAARLKEARWRHDSVCASCGSWLGNFGLEPTPEMYVEHSVLIFREVWRVLRKDGTLWVNLGDSYATGAGKVGSCPGGGDRWTGHRGARGGHEGKHGSWAGKHPGRMRQNGLATNSGASMGPDIQPNRLPIEGRKPGDLVGIPWLVAFALQRDGWYLRRDNIWHKPNPMPESVNGWRWERHRVKVSSGSVSRHGLAGVEEPHGASISDREGAKFQDCPGCSKCSPHDGLVLRKGAWRCTTSHEYVFQFSKAADYFCDAEAAKERTSGTAHPRGMGVNPKAKLAGKNSKAHKDHSAGLNGAGSKQNSSFSAAVSGILPERNRRSVWRITTSPYKEAHFATFPPALIRPIIQAASPKHCCASCGAPYAPTIERVDTGRVQKAADGWDTCPGAHGTIHRAGRKKGESEVPVMANKVSGYRPTCKCRSTVALPVVLDIFGGSGTTGQVAIEEGRAAILIELNPAYIPLIERRTTVTKGLGL